MARQISTRVKGPSKRDYRTEYARRKRAGLLKGLTPGQARGHPAPGEAYLSGRKPSAPLTDKRFQLGLRTLRERKSLREAAKAAGASPEHFKYEAAKRNALVKSGRRWIVNPDVPRRVPIFSRRRLKAILVDTPTASVVGRFMSAVGQFTRTRDRSLVTAYSGRGVVDTSGKRHPFETDPNELYRLTSAEDTTFEQIYRIVI